MEAAIWWVYHFHDTSPSAPVMGLCNMLDSDVLHGNAANLAAFLMHMEQSHPVHFARIEETVRQVAPFLVPSCRQDPVRLAEWLQEYTLGQLWEKNELGGQS